jgi:hypothetical protein
MHYIYYYYYWKMWSTFLHFSLCYNLLPFHYKNRINVRAAVRHRGLHPDLAKMWEQHIIEDTHHLLQSPCFLESDTSSIAGWVCSGDFADSGERFGFCHTAGLLNDDCDVVPNIDLGGAFEKSSSPSSSPSSLPSSSPSSLFLAQAQLARQPMTAVKTKEEKLKFTSELLKFKKEKGMAAAGAVSTATALVTVAGSEVSFNSHFLHRLVQNEPQCMRAIFMLLLLKIHSVMFHQFYVSSPNPPRSSLLSS